MDFHEDFCILQNKLFDESKMHLNFYFVLDSECKNCDHTYLDHILHYTVLQLFDLYLIKELPFLGAAI